MKAILALGHKPALWRVACGRGLGNALSSRAMRLLDFYIEESSRGATILRCDLGCGLSPALGKTLMFAVCAAVLGCAGMACRSMPAGPAVVILEGRGGVEVRVRVEVVSRPEEMSRGLMFRDRLAADAGMLFVYPSEGERSFWMKNTLIPLDMAFIGENRRIVGIVHEAEPLTTSARSVDAPSRFVLEVNGGSLRRNGVLEGALVRFENVPGLGP